MLDPLRSDSKQQTVTVESCKIEEGFIRWRCDKSYAGATVCEKTVFEISKPISETNLWRFIEAFNPKPTGVPGTATKVLISTKIVIPETAIHCVPLKRGKSCCSSCCESVSQSV